MMHALCIASFKLHNIVSKCSELAKCFNFHSCSQGLMLCFIGCACTLYSFPLLQYFACIAAFLTCMHDFVEL